MSNYEEALAAFQRTYFRDLLKWTKGNVREVAKVAGVDRCHLYDKLRKLGVDWTEFREKQQEPVRRWPFTPSSG